MKANAKSQLIERTAVTDASGHDSQKLAELADGTVSADSAWRNAKVKKAR